VKALRSDGRVVPNSAAAAFTLLSRSATAKARSASARSVRIGWAASPEDVERGSACAGDSRCRAGTIDLYLWIDILIGYVRSFDIKIITVMRSGWEQTARRPRITRRWWAPPGTQDEENQPP
jgi:hypothetical protein